MGAFIAPEVIRKDKHSTKSDIWSLGVIVYNMVTGRLPFIRDVTFNLLHALATGNVDIVFPEDTSELIMDFGRKCLTIDVASRPCTAALLEHPMVQNGGSACPPSAERPRLHVDLVPLRASSPVTELTDKPVKQRRWIPSCLTTFY